MRLNKARYIVDLQKAFDNVNWKILLQILKENQIDYRDRRIIYSMYRKQETEIQIDDSEVRTVKIKKGVRQ